MAAQVVERCVICQKPWPEGGYCPRCDEDRCSLCRGYWPEGGYCPRCQDVIDEINACPGCGCPSNKGDWCPGCEDKLDEAAEEVSAMGSLLWKDRRHFVSKAALLDSSFWRDLKGRIVRKQRQRCDTCRETRPLDLPHKAYPYCGNPTCRRGTCWGYERETQMVALCRRCHLAAHVDKHGKFWPDPAERYRHESTSHREG